jgi:hypothetical protein
MAEKNAAKTDGPLFNGRAAAAMRNYAEDLDAELADKGRELVLQHLGKFLQHPTGYYESRVRVEQRGSAHLVTDSGVIYGPWLAGTGSRNKSTRFKGYKHWRLAAQELDRSSPGTAARLLPRYLNRAGG